MESKSHLLIELFGLDKRFDDLECGIIDVIQHDIIPYEWWYPEKKLYHQNVLNVGTKLKKIAQFSPSSKKIITNLGSNVDVWDTGSGALLSCCPITEMEILSVNLNKEETNMFAVGKHGRRFCFDIQHNKLAWIKKGVSGLHEYTQLNDDATQLTIGGWNKSILVDAITGKQKKTLWDHHDEDNSKTISADFEKNTSKVLVFHNGLLQQKGDEDLHYKPLLPSNAHSPIYNREQNRLIYFYNDKDEVGILSLATEKEKVINCVRRLGCTSRHAEMSKDGTRLLVCEWSDKKQKDFLLTTFIAHTYSLYLL